MDPLGGRRQQYVEDCQVCCKPNLLTIVFDSRLGEWAINAQLESA